MRKPTLRIAGRALLLGGLVSLAGVTAEAQITPASAVNSQRAAATAPAAPTYTYTYRPGGYGYYYYYTLPYYGTPYAPVPKYAPTYGYSQPGYSSHSGATVAGYRYLDGYAAGRGLPLAKPWAKPLR